MSGSLHAWYSLGDLGALGEHQATLSGEIELHRLARLRDMLHADRGSVRVSLRFGDRDRSGGYSGSSRAGPVGRGAEHLAGRLTEHVVYVPLELEFETTLSVLCQRCLEPLEQHVSERIRMALVDTPSMESRVPEDREPVVLEGDRIMPATLIEDELIICMPLVPRHARIEQCGALVRRIDAPAPEAAGEEPREGDTPGTKDCLSPRSH